MKAQRILFPTDFSKLSEAALEYAAALARDSGGRLLIVHVEPLIPFGESEMYFASLESNTDALRKLLEFQQPRDGGIPCEYRLLRGPAADEIVRLARQEQADLIVMATHGRTGLIHLLMGSVAEAVVRCAHCPVLTFRPELLDSTEGITKRQSPESTATAAATAN